MKKTGRKSETGPLRPKSGKLAKKGVSSPASHHFNAAAELKESEERYRLLFENSGEAILLTNPDGSIYSANPAACRMYGRTEDEICKIGRDGIIDLNDPRFESAINERNKTGKFKGEINQVRKDGTIFPTEITSTVFRDSSGNERTSMIVRDISEHRKAENALAESKMILTSIIDSTDDLIWSVEPDQFRLLTFNKALEVFFKKEGIQIEKGMLLEEFLPDELVKKLKLIYSQTLQEGSVVTEYQTTIGNRALLISLHLLSNEGRPFAISVFAKDITDRKIAEDELKQSLDWQKAIFNGSRDAIFISDQDSRFVAVNKAGTDITGYPLEMLLKMRIPDIHDLNDLTAYKMYHQRIFGGEEILSEAKILRSDGLKIDTEFNNKRILIAGKHYMHTTARDITQRKNAERELHLQSEILKNIGEGVNLVRLDNEIIVFTNLKFDEMFGYEHGELIGKNVSIVNASGSNSPDETKKDIVDSVSRLGEWNGEILNIKKNGNKFWCYVNISTFVHPEYGKVYLSVHSDINIRRQTEEALNLEKENFRRSLDDSPLGIRIVSADGDTIYANQAILNFYGYDNLEELQKTPLKKRYTPESYAESQIRKQQRNQGDLSTINYEISIIRKDGKIRHLRVLRKEVLWDGILQFQVIYEDITERKQADEALRESETRFRSIFENSFVGISIARPEGGLIHVNPAYARMYGYENPEILLAQVHDTTELFANPEERKEVLRELDSNGFMEAKEFELIRRDGSRFFALVSAREIRDNEGKLLYNQATHIDLTERKKIEKELLDSKELLEKLNQHLNEVREDERSAISREIHDELGQSMTALKLDLGGLYKYVSTNTEAVIRLDSMIKLISDTIKDVQRISSDLRPGILDELGLVSAIEWYCDEFETRTGIKCTLQLDNTDFSNSKLNLTLFRALQEAFTNVIRHAKASSVDVQLHNTDQGTTLTIKDNGVGVSEEEINSNKSLGLISMRERVKQFNGKIEISSEKGDGTELIVFIPS